MQKFYWGTAKLSNREIAGAEIAIIPHTNHSLPQTQADAIAKLILQFLRISLAGFHLCVLAL